MSINKVSLHIILSESLFVSVTTIKQKTQH